MVVGSRWPRGCGGGRYGCRRGRCAPGAAARGQGGARLRVSTKSVYQWRRRWRAGGEQALASKGPGGTSCRLSDAQLERLRTELERGPAAHGWADQRWTRARIATLIGRLFHHRYAPRGTAYLLPPDGLVAAGAAAPGGRAR